MEEQAWGGQGRAHKSPLGMHVERALAAHTWYRLSVPPSLEVASSIHWPTRETAHTTSVALASVCMRVYN